MLVYYINYQFKMLKMKKKCQCNLFQIDKCKKKMSKPQFNFRLQRTSRFLSLFLKNKKARKLPTNK